jgi:hypothetical protein
LGTRHKCDSTRATVVAYMSAAKEYYMLMEGSITINPTQNYVLFRYTFHPPPPPPKIERKPSE